MRAQEIELTESLMRLAELTTSIGERLILLERALCLCRNAGDTITAHQIAGMITANPRSCSTPPSLAPCAESAARTRRAMQMANEAVEAAQCRLDRAMNDAKEEAKELGELQALGVGQVSARMRTVVPTMTPFMKASLFGKPPTMPFIGQHALSRSTSPIGQQAALSRSSSPMTLRKHPTGHSSRIGHEAMPEQLRHTLSTIGHEAMPEQLRHSLSTKSRLGDAQRRSPPASPYGALHRPLASRLRALTE